MHRKTKTRPLASFKAIGDDGTFEALVSVFGNVDFHGDRVVKGAFAADLEQWRASGDPIPVIWSHQWDNPDAHIGVVTDALETDDGLLVKGQIDLDDPAAAKIFRLMKGRRVKEFSFAYDVVEEQRGTDGANELRRLSIFEVGPTLKGANPATQLLDVKAAAARAPEEGKAVVTLDGSIEGTLRGIGQQVRAWASDMLGDDLYAAYVEATFEDHVIAYVEAWDDPVDGGDFYRVAYTAADGEVEIGEAEMVELAATVVPKSQRRHGATRRAAQKSGPAKPTAKPEGEERSARSPADTRQLIDLELLEA